MSTLSSKITTTIQNQIAQITLNNPEKSNALDVEMRDTLIETYRTLEKNPDVRIIILNGTGKHFCAGADLNHMQQMTTVSPEENLSDAKQFAQLFYQIYQCEKPTICCAHGKVVGGGLGLMSACDIAIATQESTFCFTEVKLGLMPATIAPFVLLRTGFQAAKYYMMTAELFDAQKALKIGMIDHIVANKTPLDHALTLAKSMLQNNQTSMQATKKWLRTLRPVTPEQMNQAAIQLANIRGKTNLT